MIDLGTTYDEVTSENKEHLKKKLKINARSACFKELKSKLSSHKKIKHIQYKSFEIQSYLRSPNLHPEEMQTITALRSKCVKTIRTNFSSMYKNRIQCPLKCSSENPQVDTQDHLLTCASIQIHNPTQLSIQLVYSDIAQQEVIGKLICKSLKIRRKLLEDIDSTQSS